MSELGNLAEDARSLLFHFPQKHVADLEMAFEATFCEFVGHPEIPYMHLSALPSRIRTA